MNPITPCQWSEGFGSVLLTVLTAVHFSLSLALFLLLCAALPGWETMTSAPMAFWDLQCNPDFTFTASWVGISGPPCGDLPATPALLSFWEAKVPQLYYSCISRDFKSRTAWSVLPRLAACLGWSLPAFWKTFAHLQKHYCFFFLTEKFLRSFPFTRWRISRLVSCPEDTTAFLQFQCNPFLISFRTSKVWLQH